MYIHWGWKSCDHGGMILFMYLKLRTIGVLIIGSVNTAVDITTVAMLVISTKCPERI